MGSIVLIALAVGSAVLGPVFQVAVVRSYLITRIAEEPPDATGLSRLFVPDRKLDLSIDVATERAVAAVRSRDRGPFAEPVISWETKRVPTQSMTAPVLGPHGRLRSGGVMLLAKSGACDHLQIDGRCPRGPREAIALRADLEYSGVEVGDRVRLPGIGSVRLVGSYRAPPAEEEAYWYDLDRMTSQRFYQLTSGVVPYHPAPLIVDHDAFAGLGAAHWRVRIDRAVAIGLDWDQADLDAAAKAARAVSGPNQRIDEGVLIGDPIGDLAAVIVEVNQQQQTARASIAPAVLAMVLVALALLMRLLLAASELRLEELALAALRGVGERRLWTLGLVEPAVMGIIGIPVGILLGLLGSSVLVRSWLVPGLPMPLPLTAILAPATVILATAAIAVGAVGMVLRTSLATKLAGQRRPEPSKRWVLAAEMSVLAAAGLMLITKLSGQRAARPDLVDLILPVALAVAGGLIATRLIGALAGMASRRAEQRLPGFVAARTLGRRREGTLVILPLTAAIAVGAFGLGVYSAAAQWRTSVAATTAPGHTLWSSNANLSEAMALTHALDPEGEHLMALGDYAAPGARLSVVDAPRMAKVLTWPSSWVPGMSVQEVQRAIESTGSSPSFVGTSLALEVDNQVDAETDLTVEVQVGTRSGEVRKGYLGPITAGKGRYAMAFSDCPAGCTLDRISIGGGAATKTTMAGVFTITGISVDGVPVPGAVTESGWDRSLGIGGVEDIATVEVVAGAVQIDIDSAGAPGLVRLVAGEVPDSRPIIRGRDNRLGLDGGRPELGLQVPISGAPMAVTPVATGDSAPLTGPAGSLIDYQMLFSDRLVFDAPMSVFVVSNSSTPESLRQALTESGFTVSTTLAAERRVLNQSAYALALRLYAVIAVLVLVMAAAGLVVSTAVQLPARRRDAAALRVVGVPRRLVASAVTREFLVVLGAAGLTGIVAGTLAQYVVVKTVRLGYVEDLSTPRLVAHIDPWWVTSLAGTAIVALGAFALISAMLTVRGARGATLRESAR